MGRIHLFEFEDLSWFPDTLRNYGTDFLQFLANKTPMLKPTIPILREFLEEVGTTRIIDLGSGGGGGWLGLSAALKNYVKKLQITLTDLYPNLDAFNATICRTDCIDFVDYPVDAREVPGELKGVRTQFLSLHHFKPADAVKILQSAVDAKAPIAIFEAQERSIPSFLAMFFSPITILLTTPFIRPFRVTRLLFTYLIPIVPLFVWWDGMISVLRTYSVKEMDELIDQVKDKDRFTWTTARIKSGPGVILYLTGKPKIKPLFT